MSRVPNLLATPLPSNRPETGVASASAGHDFDDMLARASRAEPVLPAPGNDARPADTERPAPERDDASSADRRAQAARDDTRRLDASKARADRAERADSDQARSDRADRARSEQAAADRAQGDDRDAGGQRERLQESKAREKQAQEKRADERGAVRDRGDDRRVRKAGRTRGDHTDDPGTAKDAAAAGAKAHAPVIEPVAGVVVDPALLAAMVTTPSTALAPATAPEPESGMVSVAAVDGGTAVIVTAPATDDGAAAGSTDASATAPADGTANGAASATGDGSPATGGGPGGDDPLAAVVADVYASTDVPVRPVRTGPGGPDGQGAGTAVPGTAAGATSGTIPGTGGPAMAGAAAAGALAPAATSDASPTTAPVTGPAGAVAAGPGASLGLADAAGAAGGAGAGGPGAGAAGSGGDGGTTAPPPGPGVVNPASGTPAAGPAATPAPAGPASPAGATMPISDQVVAQIQRQLQGARTLRDGTHHAVLRLSPEHLGDVTIALDVRAGGVRLDLAAGPQAISALQSDLGRLRDDLAGAGLNLGDVTLHSNDAGGQAFARDRGQGDPAAAGADAPAPIGPAPAVNAPGRAPVPGRRLDGGIDLLA
jgi:Flagellar hook-length control protein FliK